MQRLITCQRATLLLEQQADQRLPQEVRAGLLVHLRDCPHCYLYATQTLLIAKLARAAATARETAGSVLPAAAKERMRQRLAEA